MNNIFEQLARTDYRSESSLNNAKKYLNKLVEAISILKDVHNISNSNEPFKRFSATDTIIETAPININGKFITFKMIFDDSRANPYAVKINDFKEEHDK